MSCVVCSEVILNPSDLIICTGECQANFHLTCAGYSDKSRKLTPALKKKWLCVSCLAATKSSTPKDENPGLQQPSSSETQAFLDQLSRNIMDAMSNKLDEFKVFVSSKLDDFQKSLDFQSDVIKDLKETVAQLTTTTSNLKLEYDQLKSENSTIKKELKYVKQEIVELQQYSRRSNIEINNLPEVENENLSDVLGKIGSLTQCNLKDNIVVAHRIQTFNKDKPKPIIVQFTSKPVRDSMLKLLKDRKLKTTDISPRSVDMPIYFNEHLAPDLKKLFYLARKFKTENNFLYCWIKDGKILLRKSESTRILRIKNEDDLNVQFNK